MFFNNDIRIPLEIRNIEDDGCHLMVYGRINDFPALLLIDTGASRSVFDINRMSGFIGDTSPSMHDKLSTGLGTSDMVTHTVNFSSFQLGDLIIKDFEAVLLDLTHVNTSYEKLEFLPIDGVIGGDLLMKLEAVIDFRNKILILKNKKI